MVVGGMVLVVGPVPVGEVVLVGQRGERGALWWSLPEGRVVVVVGPEVVVEKKMVVVVVGHGPTPPPGGGQSRWTDGVGVPVHPNLARAAAIARRAAGWSPNVACALRSRSQIRAAPRREL